MEHTTLAYPGRVMGLDVGEARTGIALSDPMQSIATPHSVIRVTSPEADIAAIRAAAADHSVVGIVVGLPYNLKGEIGPQAEKVLRFVELLRAAVDLEVVLQDERMTTALGQRALTQAGVKRNKKKQAIDQIAAAQILQTWLDRAAYQRKANP